MVDKRHGWSDGPPLDNNAEKISQPQAGQIWRQDFEGNDEAGFYKILSIKNPDDPERKKYSIVRVNIQTRQRSGKPINVGSIRFGNKYTFVSKSEDEFFLNLSPEDKKKRQGPIRALEELGAPLPPVIGERIDTGAPGDSDPGELVLDNVVSQEMDEEAQEESEPEEEAVAISEPLPDVPEDVPVPDLTMPISEPDEAIANREKEALEEALSQARLAFAQADYEHSTKTITLKKFFNLKEEAIPAHSSLEELGYKAALTKVRDFELQQLQDSLRGTSDAEQKEKMESFLLRYRYQEAAALYAAGKEAKLAVENETFFGQVKTKLQEVGNGYRKMGWKKKLAIGGSIVGVSLVGGTAVAGIAGLILAAKSAVTVTATFLAVDEGANKFFNNKDLKKAKEEIKNVTLDQLLEATNKSLSNIPKDLERLKTRENKIKIAALAGAIGLPAVAGPLLDAFSGPEIDIKTEGLGKGDISETLKAENQIVDLPPTLNSAETVIYTVDPNDAPVLAPDVNADAAPAPPAEPVVPVPDPEPTNAPLTAEQKEGAGYLNSDTIGFGSTPLTEREQYWQDVQRVQGNAIDPEAYRTHISYNPSSEGVGFGEPGEGIASQDYTLEMSDYRSLLENPPAGVSIEEVRVAQRESLTLLREQTFNIDNTEFGPDHQFTNMNMTAIERQYQSRPITEVMHFNGEQYRDYRPEFRQREWEYRTNRGIYLDPINPGPTLNSPPDAYAIASMDQIKAGYRQNLGEMARAARDAFGPAGAPIDTAEYRETVRAYTLRITTLYTRARLENPNFRLNF